MKKIRTLTAIIISIIMISVMAIVAFAGTVTVWSADSTEGSWGAPGVVELVDGPNGGKAVSMVLSVDGADAQPNIICYAFPGSPIDLSAADVMAEGSVHLWVYVSDTAEIISAPLNSVIEFSAEGLHCIKWNIHEKITKNGWNEITLKFSDALVDEGTNLSSIQQMRIFQYGFNFTLAVDDITITAPSLGGSADTPNPGTGNMFLFAVLLCGAAGTAVAVKRRKSIA